MDSLITEQLISQLKQTVIAIRGESSGIGVEIEIFVQKPANEGGAVIQTEYVKITSSCNWSPTSK